MAESIYSAESDLNLDADRLVELTDTALAPGVKQQAVLDTTSFEAQDIIDGTLQGVYVVPFTTVPPQIKRLHADIWRYFLFKHRDALSIPQSVIDEYKQARADLDDYGTGGEGGKILYGAARVSAATTPGATSGTFPADINDTNVPTRVFGRFKDNLG